MKTKPIKLSGLVLVLVCGALLTSCSAVRATGDTVEAVGEGTGHAVESVGDGAGHIVEGTGRAIGRATEEVY